MKLTVTLVFPTISHTIKAITLVPHGVGKFIFGQQMCQGIKCWPVMRRRKLWRPQTSRNWWPSGLHRRASVSRDVMVFILLRISTAWEDLPSFMGCEEVLPWRCVGLKYDSNFLRNWARASWLNFLPIASRAMHHHIQSAASRGQAFALFFLQYHDERALLYHHIMYVS